MRDISLNIDDTNLGTSSLGSQQHAGKFKVFFGSQAFGILTNSGADPLTSVPTGTLTEL